MFSKTSNSKLLEGNPVTHFRQQYLDSEGWLPLDSPAEVAAVPSVPRDVAPPPAGPLHLRLLHSRHNRGRSFHLLGRGRRPAHLLHCGRLLLLLMVAGGHHLALPDEVDLSCGRHPLRLPLPWSPDGKERFDNAPFFGNDEYYVGIV